MQRSSVVGTLMLIVGIVGAVVGVGGALAGQRLVGDVVRDAELSLELVSDALDAAETSIILAGSAVVDLQTAVGTAAGAADSVAVALADSEVLIGEVARITGEDLPDSIDAVDAAMPGLIRVAGLVDNTLRAARLFGVDYDPEKPFDEAVADLDASLEGMPDDLRTQAALLTQSTEDIVEVSNTARRLSDDLSGLADELSATAEVLNEYQSTAVEADRLVAELRDDLETRGNTVRAIVLAFGLLFAAGQIVPLWLGYRLAGPGLPLVAAGGEAQEAEGH